MKRFFSVTVVVFAIFALTAVAFAATYTATIQKVYKKTYGIEGDSCNYRGGIALLVQFKENNFRAYVVKRALKKYNAKSDDKFVITDLSDGCNIDGYDVYTIMGSK